MAASTSAPPAQEDANLFEDILNCGICYESYEQPKALPCLHTFCQKCLEQYAAKDMGLFITCPLCRQRHTMPPSGKVENLPDNFLISKVTDFISEQSGGASRCCSICMALRKYTASMFFCNECNRSLCIDCSEAHQTTAVTSDHTLTDAEEMVFCPSHLSEEFKFFCKSCQLCVCVVCVQSRHKDCDVLKISHDLAEEKRQDLQLILGDCLEIGISVDEKLKTTANECEQLRLQLSQLINQCDGLQNQSDFIKNALAQSTKVLHERNDIKFLRDFKTSIVQLRKVLENQIDNNNMIMELKPRSFEQQPPPEIISEKFPTITQQRLQSFFTVQCIIIFCILVLLQLFQFMSFYLCCKKTEFTIQLTDVNTKLSYCYCGSNGDQ